VPPWLNRNRDEESADYTHTAAGSTSADAAAAPATAAAIDSRVLNACGESSLPAAGSAGGSVPEVPPSVSSAAAAGAGASAASALNLPEQPSGAAAAGAGDRVVCGRNTCEAGEAQGRQARRRHDGCGVANDVCLVRPQAVACRTRFQPRDVGHRCCLMCVEGVPASVSRSQLGARCLMSHSQAVAIFFY
jgi:hypothetical protein